MSKSTPQGIPIRRVQLNHLSELPSNYGTTPGGTYYSTTPGGTRIIYDRSFLLKCRSSPMSNTPPSNLPDIPGVTSPDKSPLKSITKIVHETEVSNGKENGGNFNQRNLMSQHASNVITGFGAFVNAESPLQMYRERTLMQQKALAYDTVCQPLNEAFKFPANVVNNALNIMSPPFNPTQTIKQPSFNENTMNSGDREWQANNIAGLSLNQMGKNTHTVSPLNLWRQSKMGQENPPSTHGIQLLPPNNPNLSLYRGRGRGLPQQLLPGSLCKPMENLFMSHSLFLPYAAYGNGGQHGYLPAYDLNKDDDQFDMEI